VCTLLLRVSFTGRLAGGEGRFEPELYAEMVKLRDADLVIWHFPLYWFSVPAMLKGWADKVLAMGMFYGGAAGIYKPHGKKAVLCFTTGGPEGGYKRGGL
jgi:NAD(P)H dehydrogenase (quinone)